jgi:hypothetical protein
MRTAALIVTLSLLGVLMVAGCPTTAPVDGGDEGTPTGGTDGTGGGDAGTGDSTGDDSSGGGGGSGTGDTPDQTASVATFLPTSVSLDIDELPEDEIDQTAQAFTPQNNYQRAVRSAATVVHRFQYLADRALALGATINTDLADEDQTQVSGSFTVAGPTFSYKADFAAFDIDGDGEADGSGNPVDTPIAVRMWVDRGTGYVRWLCALVDVKPSTDNFGRGELYLQPYALHNDTPSDVRIYINYDRTDETHRWNEAFVAGELHPEHRLATGTARVDVRASGSDTEKTVRTSYDFQDNPYGFETFRSAVHYLRGGAGLLVSAVSSGGQLQIGFENICVVLADQTLAQNGECDDYDTQDMTLLDVPTGTESDLPADFPEQPTF